MRFPHDKKVSYNPTFVNKEHLERGYQEFGKVANKK